MGNYTSSVSSPTTHYHDPSELDVFDVRDMMTIIFPIELVDIILNEAEYWPLIVTECPIKRFAVSAYEPPICCIISPQIPYSSQPLPLSKEFIIPGGDEDVVADSKYDTAPSLRRKVKRVEFQLTSCDQGWGGEDMKHPYAGAWSWFDAEIWRPDSITSHSPTTSITHPFLSHLQNLPSNGQLRSGGYQRVELPETADGEKCAWLVQRNRRADSRVRTHFVIWTDDDFVDHSSTITDMDIHYEESFSDSDSDDDSSESSGNQDSLDYNITGLGHIPGTSNNDSSSDSSDDDTSESSGNQETADYSTLFHNTDNNSNSYSDDNSSESSGNQDQVPEVKEDTTEPNASLADLHGCGNGFGFARSLQPGDRIALVVHARFPGWENYIRGTVSLKVYYTVIG